MSERRLVTIALFVSTFLVALDSSVVSTAMPTVIGQIGGIHLYAWVFSAYLLTSTVTVPIYGKLADLFGRKPVFMLSTVVFLFGSMLCGQSQTMEQLIAFRLLQGLGAGGMLPINQTILGDVYPLEQRARITGLFSTVWGVSGLLGPAVGGFLTEHVSWRWVFYVNFPLCVLSMLLISRFLHEHIQHRRHSIDYLGAAALSASVAVLLLTLHAGLWMPAGAELVLGFGFGFYTVTTVLAAQAAVGWEHRGVVTSASQFARNIGGTVGVSIAGAIFAAGVVGVTGAGINPNDLLSPATRADLAGGDLAMLQILLASALRSVYTLFIVMAILATAIAAFLPGGRPRQESDAGPDLGTLRTGSR